MGYARHRLPTPTIISPRKPLVWTPLSPATPSDYFAAYWTADDYGTARMTDAGSGKISSWKDNIAALDLTQATDAARPVYSATVINGGRYPGVVGDGVDDFLEGATTGLPLVATAGEIFVFGEYPTPSGTPFLFVYGGTSANRALTQSANGRPRLHEGSTAHVDASNRLTISPFVMRGRWAGTEQTGRLNGVDFPNNPGTIATLATNSTRTRMFCNAGNTPGAFAALRMFATIVVKVDSATEVLPGRNTTLSEDLVGWGMWRMGAERRLAYNHPWKRRPPL